MPAIDHRHARVAVEIFLPLRIEQILHLALDELRRLLVEMPETRHDVLPLLLNDRLRAHKSFHRIHPRLIISFYVIIASIEMQSF